MRQSSQLVIGAASEISRQKSPLKGSYERFTKIEFLQKITENRADTQTTNRADDKFYSHSSFGIDGKQYTVDFSRHHFSHNQNQPEKQTFFPAMTWQDRLNDHVNNDPQDDLSQNGCQNHSDSFGRFGQSSDAGHIFFGSVYPIYQRVEEKNASHNEPDD